MASAPADNLNKTVLFAQHEAAGGRIVPFGGYALPVQYPTGIIAEHKWTREHAGLFDVSHMGPCTVTLTDPTGDPGADHAAVATLVEPLVCGDIAGLKPGQIRYTLMLNEAGGTLDDLMIARAPRIEHSGTLYIVVNAGTKEADFARIETALDDKALFKRVDEGALLALQGPDAFAVMADLVPEATDLSFMTYGVFGWRDAHLKIARAGYTGEDGFEILCPAKHAVALWEALLADERVNPIGLGARDSLRLEAGLPLYGHDLDETVSPIEAGLNFAVSKRRRTTADFPGAQRILAEIADGPARVRVGLLVDGAPAREGAAILDSDGAEIGVVTSGGFAPSLGRAVALGFVPPAHAAPGMQLQVSVRGRAQTATVTELPFVPHRYVRKPAGKA